MEPEEKALIPPLTSPKNLDHNNEGLTDLVVNRSSGKPILIGEIVLRELLGHNWETNLKATGALLKVPTTGEIIFVQNSAIWRELFGDKPDILNISWICT